MMFAGDDESLAVEMCKKWPNKFSDTDLQYWCRELKNFRLPDVLEVLTAFKAASKYVPKLPEIKERLAKRGSAVVKQVQRYLTVLGRDVVRASPHLDGRPEAELILRYHRRWWFAYRADSVSRGQMQGLQGQAIETVNRERKLENLTNEAVRDLVSMGMGHELALRTAPIIDWPEARFADALMDLEAIEEVPV